MVALDRRKLFIKYLLGTASDSERDEVELSFVDDSTFDAFLVTEQDLIKGYLRQELTARDRALFEENYLKDSPENAKKVFVATAVLNHFTPHDSTLPLSDAVTITPKGWWTRVRNLGLYGVAASAISFIAIGLLIGYLYIAALRNEAERLRSENNKLTRMLQEERTRSREELADAHRRLEKANDELKNAIATASPSPRPEENLVAKDIYATTDGAVLGPGTSGKHTETITGETKKVRIFLVIGPGVPDGPYQVKFKLANDGERVLHGVPAKRTKHGKAVKIELRPDDLVFGNNVFYLYARQPDGSYPKDADDGYVIRIEKDRD
jgi:hypothetical protein